MKIETRRIEAVLKEIGTWRVLFLYGENTGLIREYAQNAIRQIIGDLEDPFRLARLEGDEANRLEEEALALSLAGGRRAVWLSGASDSIVPALERVLKQESDTMIVLEMPGATKRSSLRLFADKHAQIASIACYPENERDLSRLLRESLAQDGLRLTSDALAWLVGHLGADRLLVRGEVEKLSLYGTAIEQEKAKAGQKGNGELNLEDVQHCVGDSGSSSLEDALYAALAGHGPVADRLLERAMADGANPVAILRSLLSILEKLQLARILIEEGQTPKDAMKSLKPPIFFKREGHFLQALSRWKGPALADLAAETQKLEYACKQTIMPDLLLCRRHLARIYRR